MQYFVGVDIGLSGGMTLLDENSKIVDITIIPTIKVVVAKKNRNQYDINSIHEKFKEWNKIGPIVMTGFERLRAIPNQSSQTAFSMGGGTMLFKTLCTVHKMPFMEIEARSWQKEIFGSLGVQYGPKTTKQASIQAAKQLFPGVSFLPTSRSRVDSDGLTDSSNIGAYIIKKY